MSDVKKIILSSGETTELTFEEVQSRYKGMVFSTLNRANRQFRDHHLYDSEKMESILFEKLWLTYETYDYDLGNKFTTHLYNQLRAGTSLYFKEIMNQNNTALAGMISLDVEYEGSSSNGETHFSNDDSMVLGGFLDELESELMFKKILSRLDTEEEKELFILLYNHAQDRYINSSIADAMGVTRQTVYNLVAKLREKTQAIYKEEMEDAWR